MTSIPNQPVSPGHPRFVGGFVLTATQVNPDGTTEAVVDITSALTVASNNSFVLAAMDPTDNRKVIVSANPSAPVGGQVSNATITVNTSPGLPGNGAISFTAVFTPAPDRRSLTWDPATGGSQGDA